MISTRTKAALAAAKERGVKLGGPKLAQARELALETISAAADNHARIERVRHLAQCCGPGLPNLTNDRQHVGR